MAGMGPPPKPAGTRQRRNATVGTTKLPAAGRSGECPPWPLPADVVAQVTMRRCMEKAESLRDQIDDCSPRSRAKLERELDQALLHSSVLEAQVAQQLSLECGLWAELWSTPQAERWEELGWFRDVAQYVRHKVRGEMGSLDDAKEARQWSDRLGLNPLAMLRLRWETERVEEAEQRGRQRATAQQNRSAGAKAADKKDPRSVLRAV